jgi:hypothetical protein
MACSMDVPRIAEPALSCLHKLVHIHLKKLPTPLSKQVVSSAKQLPEQETMLAQVAHAYLHAESSPAGRLDDGSIVAQVHSLVSFPGHSVALVLELNENSCWWRPLCLVQPCTPWQTDVQTQSLPGCP